MEDDSTRGSDGHETFCLWSTIPTCWRIGESKKLGVFEGDTKFCFQPVLWHEVSSNMDRCLLHVHGTNVCLVSLIGGARVKKHQWGRSSLSYPPEAIFHPFESVIELICRSCVPLRARLVLRVWLLFFRSALTFALIVNHHWQKELCTSHERCEQVALQWTA